MLDLRNQIKSTKPNKSWKRELFISTGLIEKKDA